MLSIGIIIQVFSLALFSRKFPKSSTGMNGLDSPNLSAAFDVFVNDEHLPIILIESPAASTAPLTPSGPPPPAELPVSSEDDA